MRCGLRYFLGTVRRAQNCLDTTGTLKASSFDCSWFNPMNKCGNTRCSKLKFVQVSGNIYFFTAETTAQYLCCPPRRLRREGCTAVEPDFGCTAASTPRTVAQSDSHWLAASARSEVHHITDDRDWGWGIAPPAWTARHRRQPPLPSICTAIGYPLLAKLDKSMAAPTSPDVCPPC